MSAVIIGVTGASQHHTMISVRVRGQISYGLATPAQNKNVVVPSSTRNLGKRGWLPAEIGFRNPGGGNPLWAKASHQPSSEARRPEETKVGSRVEQDGRVCD